MTTFFDLPHELYPLILFHLTNRDLDALFQIDQFKELFESEIVLFTDSNNTLFPNVPLRRPLKLLPRYDSEFLIIAMCESESIEAMNKHDKAIYSLTQNRENENPDLRLIELEIKLSPITFEFIKKLVLKNTAIDPLKITFPKLEELVLDDCEYENTRFESLLSKLITLHVTGKFEPIHKSIDYKTCSIKKLSLSSITDMDRWEDISNSSIEILRVFKSLKAINNITLNGAAFVDLFEIEKLNNVNLPIVQTLNISSGAALYVDGINSPMACKANFDFKSVYRFLNVNMPNLLEASFRRRNERSDDIKLNQCDLSCFKNTSVLNITGPFLQYLRKCNATKMVLRSTEHTSGPLIEFPQLDRLVMYTTGAVPRFNAPKLSQLLISGRADRLSGFHFDYYPGLEHLFIDAPTEIIDCRMANLKVLQIMPPFGISGRMKFINCELENLEYLVVRGEDSSLVNGFSGLKAPKLLRIVLTGMSIERFSAESYPKLTKLVLNECDLRSLRLTGCPSLNFLDICKNPNLTDVESDQLNSLKTLINDNEKIKLEAPNLTRCEAKRAKCRYNSQVPKRYGWH